MICVSVGKTSFSACLRLLRTVDCAEIRLDLNSFSAVEIRKIFSRPKTLIAACRPGRLSNPIRRERLAEAVSAGASYVDVDGRESPGFRDYIKAEARRAGCRLIFSYHDFRGTPSRSLMERVIDRYVRAGADVVKIACLARTPSDCARLVSLYDRKDEGGKSLLAFAMGPAGSWTRVAATLLGAPFTFAAAGKGRETAPGQLDRKSMKAVELLLQGRTS